MTPGLKLILVGAELLTVLSAVFVAFHPNILYAAIGLLFAFVGVAVLFVFASADFLAGVQMIVYAGGVTILILFAIMLTQWLYNAKLKDIRVKYWVPVVVSVPVLIVALLKVLKPLGEEILKTPPENFLNFSNSPKTSVIGQALLSNYILAFEAVTILLLGALVGGVWLARPK